MNSFMSWVGGKKALRDAVLARFPPYYERYIEVFGGAGCAYDLAVIAKEVMKHKLILKYSTISTAI
jgi:site-specific DNA-adenine methylase